MAAKTEATKEKMGNIHVLSYHMSNQIAAGEVVHRPSSVLKELMENSLDAGSTSIRVMVEEGGKRNIQIIDNGGGMDEIDAYMCFERHATSKITSETNLQDIQTLGFRGEALASISSVAQVHLRTRTADQEAGQYVYITASKIKQRDPITTPVGSNFSIKNLFYNLPARSKFLGSATAEMRHILQVFQAIALSHPEVEFSLSELKGNKTRQIYKLPKASLIKRIGGIFRTFQKKKLVPVEHKTTDFQIKGYVGFPSEAKRYRGEQYFFVNKRYVKSGYLHHAVMKAYQGLLPEGYYPFYVFFFDIPHQEIDVNIHPAKTEVKFKD
ncbi:MAG: DNA mismatch repair endonuclease MutL, partial [Cytophagales bacterium]|nr:DNA mismatch repair endonuclease MutL [Cytophagales bacterium]